jgi:ribA/ribD-fused uncharacterized protein
MIDDFRGEYRWLSNFDHNAFELDGRRWTSNEHYYQANKALTEIDYEFIADALTPGEAKRRGREIQLDPAWPVIRDEVMWRGLYAKFTQNPNLMEKLLATGNAILIEGNTWHDTYWGVCNGKGKNKLGRMLMILRDLLGVMSGPE